MPSNEPGAVDERHSEWLRPLALVLMGLAAAVVVFVGIMIALIAHSLSHIGERKHLKPIPVAASACPFVEAMHDAANELQKAYPVFGVAFDPHGRALTWPQTRKRLARAGDVLEYSIAAGLGQFPAQVQGYLEEVSRQIQAGRAQLRDAHDEFDFFQRTSERWEDGQVAFGFAGDLIGGQCGVQLGADSDTMLFGS